MRRLRHSIGEYVFHSFLFNCFDRMIRLLPTTNMDTRRVAIVGAGAAGLSAAYALSKHPDKFIVTIFEKEPVTGGMASSMNIDPKLYGASYINDGVQGCSPTFANTLRIFRELGYPPQKVDMQCASLRTFMQAFTSFRTPGFP